MAKVRATRHNGRAGKNGVFTTKHNDRNFDLTHAEHIDPGKTPDNVYWDWLNGMRTGEKSVYECEDGSVPSFEEAERVFYEQQYGDYVAGQCLRNAQRRHSERDRTVEQIRHDKRTCPEESIFQFGREGGGATPEQLMAIFTEFREAFEKQYGSNIHMLDWAMHCDETTVHIQERHCFDYVNDYGEVEPKQEKALETLGIPLPEPEKPQGRYNNRKITFDAINRLLLIEIAKKHGLDIEETVKYGGKKHLEKVDYIIARQLETIREQGVQIAAQAVQIRSLTERITEKDQALADVREKLDDANEDLYRTGKQLEEKEQEVLRKDSQLDDLNEQLTTQSALLAEKDAELEAKELELSDVDELLDGVAEIAYDKAVHTVAATVAAEAQKRSAAAVDRVIADSKAKDSGIGILAQKAVNTWLAKVRTKVHKTMESLLVSVIEKLTAPAVKKAAKEKIRETARPAVIERLQPRLTEKKKRDHPSR